MECSHKRTCALFPKLSLKPLLQVWITNYCESDYPRCARYQLSCEQRPVPDTLLPNGKMLTALVPGSK